MATIESLPATLQLGAVHLNVSNLDRAIAWYERSLGLRLRARRREGHAGLGDRVASSVVLHEVPDAKPPRADQASMFHYCLLYPTREELARAAVRVRNADTEVTTMNDRHTHEAIYVNDADGNNVELACDRPREQWPDEPYGRTPVELNLEDLLATISGEEPTDTIGDGLVVGHVHLIVSDVEEMIRFYRDVLGMDLKYHVGNAVYLSVGGYHHHIGGRIHTGEVMGPQPADAIGLRHWVIKLANAAEVTATRQRIEEAGYDVNPASNGFSVSDPWQIPVHVVS